MTIAAVDRGGAMTTMMIDDHAAETTILMTTIATAGDDEGIGTTMTMMTIAIEGDDVIAGMRMMTTTGADAVETKTTIAAEVAAMTTTTIVRDARRTMPVPSKGK